MDRNLAIMANSRITSEPATIADVSYGVSLLSSQSRLLIYQKVITNKTMLEHNCARGMPMPPICISRIGARRLAKIRPIIDLTNRGDNSPRL